MTISDMNREDAAWLRALLRDDPTTPTRIRRLFEREPKYGSSIVTVSSPISAINALGDILLGRSTEAFAVIALNRKNEVIDRTIVTTGSERFTVVDCAQIIRWVLTRDVIATSFVVAHNHPSGDPMPSREDHGVWSRLQEAGSAVQTPCNDSLIFSDDGRVYSHAASGIVAV